MLEALDLLTLALHKEKSLTQDFEPDHASALGAVQLLSQLREEVRDPRPTATLAEIVLRVRREQSDP